MDLNQEITDLRELIQNLQKEIDSLKSENSRLHSLVGDIEQGLKDESMIPIFPTIKTRDPDV